MLSIAVTAIERADEMFASPVAFNAGIHQISVSIEMNRYVPLSGSIHGLRQRHAQGAIVLRLHATDEADGTALTFDGDKRIAIDLGAHSDMADPVSRPSIGMDPA